MNSKATKNYYERRFNDHLLKTERRIKEFCHPACQNNDQESGNFPEDNLFLNLNLR